MILVTGAKGQLGSDVCEILKGQGVPHLGIDIDDCNLTEEKQVQAVFSENSITAVLHCGAYTKVDLAEENEEMCMAVNALGTRYIAKCCSEKNIKMLYISTDYVFGGEGTEPFETNDLKNPQNIYGKSKLSGEEAIKELCAKYFIVRTSWVFGEKNTNFIHTILQLSQTGKEINVVCDQIGSPTYSKDLAALICEMIKTEKYGEYHATNQGFCSWAQLAKKTFEIAGIKNAIHEVTSRQFPSKAKRPHNSKLSAKSLVNAGFNLLEPWEEAVKKYLSNIINWGNSD